MLATTVMAVHFAVLAYIVLGAFLSWRWPRALLVHVPFLLWDWESCSWGSSAR